MSRQYRMPNSLAKTARKVSVLSLLTHPVLNLKWATETFPIKEQQELSLHLFEDNLAQFIHYHGSIIKLKKLMNEDEFQKFILHFFKELEHENLNPFSKLHAQYESFKVQLKKTFKLDVPIVNGKCTVYNLTQLDWCTRSLGFDTPILPQLLPESTYEQKFFQIKFETKFFSDRFPIPQVHSLLEKVIPENGFENHRITAHHLPLMGNQQKFHYSFPVKEPEKKSEQFFFRLSAMKKCFQNQANHEVLAYASELLTHPEFKNQKFLDKYFLHVWGMMAVSLARMNKNFSFILSCLFQMDDLIEFESEKLDAAWYRQQMASALLWFEEEKKQFRFLIALVPRSSIFFRQTFKLHLETRIKFIENCCLRLIANSELNETEKNTCFETLQNEFNFIYKELHSLLGKKNINEDVTFSEFESYFAILDVYKLIVKHFDNSSLTVGIQEKDRRIQTSSLLLYESSHHICYFLTHYVHENNIHDYRMNLKNYKEELETSSHTANPIVWADVLLAHSIFLRILAKNETQSEIYVNEAIAIYKKCNMNRWKMLRNTLTPTHQQKIEFTLPTGKVIPNLNIVSLLNKEPSLKFLVRSGIDSLLHYDFV